MPGQASKFYEEATIAAHLQIGVTAAACCATRDLACTAASCTHSTNRRLGEVSQTLDEHFG